MLGFKPVIRITKKVSVCLLTNIITFLLDGNFLAIGSHDNYIYIYAVTESGRKYSRMGKCSVSTCDYFSTTSTLFLISLHISVIFSFLLCVILAFVHCTLSVQ